MSTLDSELASKGASTLSLKRSQMLFAGIPIGSAAARQLDAKENATIRLETANRSK